MLKRKECPVNFGQQTPPIAKKRRATLLNRSASSSDQQAKQHQQAALTRSPISRQIKFHEYKGPPQAKRQAAALSHQANQTKARHQQQVSAREAIKVAVCEPLQQHQQPHQQQHYHSIRRASEPLQAASQSQTPLQQRRHLTGSIGSHDSTHFHSSGQPLQLQLERPLQSASLVQDDGLFHQAFSTSLSSAGGRDHGSQVAPQLPAIDQYNNSIMVPQQQQQQQQQQQHQQQRQLELVYNEASTCAVNSYDRIGECDPFEQQQQCDQLEPTISFSNNGVSIEESSLLFSEFIDFQDIPLNVDESDWLKKFLPPCSN